MPLQQHTQLVTDLPTDFATSISAGLTTGISSGFTPGAVPAFTPGVAPTSGGSLGGTNGAAPSIGPGVGSGYGSGIGPSLSTGAPAGLASGFPVSAVPGFFARLPFSRPQPPISSLWAGTMATAMIAALLAVLGVVTARTFRIDIVGPRGGPAFVDTTVYQLTFAAAVGALGAGALAHALLYLTPMPLLFLGWITSLATAVLVLWPFTTTAGVASKIATAVLHLAIGVAVSSLVMMLSKHAATNL
jgi:hypothetical protein